MPNKKEIALELDITVDMPDEYARVCNYFLLYAQNLNTNWLYSQEIFQQKLLPSALKDPQEFALIVDKMVDQSGENIRYKLLFSKAIKSIKSFASSRKAKVKYLSMAINDLLESGLKNSVYAKKAIEYS